MVITDHSTAAIEAAILGVPTVCYRGAALKELQQRYPTLSELEYLTHTSLYDDVSQLQAILNEFPKAAAAKSAQRIHQARGARTLLLDICLQQAA